MPQCAGVAFKEGLCYNKPEAAGLFGAVPLLMLGHLSGLLPKPAVSMYTPPGDDDDGMVLLCAYTYASVRGSRPGDGMWLCMCMV